MEHFLESLLTIAFSLVISFAIAKILSLASKHVVVLGLFDEEEDRKKVEETRELENKFPEKVIEENENIMEVETIDGTEGKKLPDERAEKEKTGETDDNDDEDDDGDDWEGIERTELERVFASALAFVGSNGTAAADQKSRFNKELKEKLYGLHKVAIQGPCREPPPMALKLSARAKWNAWQGLGNMNREIAMEQFISLLSSQIPGWAKDRTKDYQSI